MQHDGAPPHYALCSRQVMNLLYFTDLTSPDYILWSFVKERVMAVTPTTPDDVKERIR